VGKDSFLALNSGFNYSPFGRAKTPVRGVLAFF
jgi:hypothetical protein